MVARLLQPPPPFALPPPLCPSAAYALAPPAVPTLVEAQATWRLVGLVCLATLCAILVFCCRPTQGS